MLKNIFMRICAFNETHLRFIQPFFEAHLRFNKLRMKAQMRFEGVHNHPKMQPVSQNQAFEFAKFYSRNIL